MTTWAITVAVVLVLVLIVSAEIRHNRQTRTFFDHINPEINALTTRVVGKYRAKYGRDPTTEYPIVNLDTIAESRRNARK